MSWIESIQKAINYIEEHLHETITMEQIAQEVNASVFHFQRTFSILTDMSIADYIRRRRLTLAAQELINTDSKVIDIAYKYGYDSPEAFTKAFRKQHNVTPSEVRKQQGAITIIQSPDNPGDFEGSRTNEI
ncbi:AraC family transcriptional regulator OS=Lysinibacillus sphaericus OX=1421 GN=LS41612_16445 PE=4 SV=1 [Lysinibacillus sphaericus]